MDQDLVFHNPRKGSCPIYVQEDASIGLVKPTKDHIENFGGLVTEDPQKAIVLIVVNRNTYLGSKLIADYAGESTGKGVVDQAWVLECIRQGRMLGPPEWGGYALYRHTAHSYFDDDTDENASGIIRNDSPVTVGVTGDHLQSTGHTVLRSSGSSGHRTSRTPTTASRAETQTIPQRPSVSQQSSLKPKTSAQPFKPSKVSRPKKTKAHVRIVPTEVGERNKGARHTGTKSTPQPPLQEDSMPIGATGKFSFTDAEKAYVRARFERARANRPVRLNEIAHHISEAIPWHSAKSVENYIRRQEWYEAAGIKKTSYVSTSDTRLPGRGTIPVTQNIAQEMAQSGSSPTEDDEIRSSAEESNNSDSESDIRSTSEPPKTPPKHNVIRIGGGNLYTDTDKEFVIQYLAWAKRNPASLQGSVYSRMNELMPWHSATSIQSFVCKNPNLFGHNIISRPSQRLLGSAGLEYRLQQGKGTKDTSSLKRRLLEVADSRTSTRSVRIKRAQKIIPSTKGKAPSALSDAVIEAMVLALKSHPEAHWAPNNTQKRTRLWSDFAKIHPNHSAESYHQYHIEHRKQLESAANKMIEDEESTDDGLKRRPKPQGSVASIINSLVQEGKLEIPVRPSPSKPGSPYSWKDCLTLIQYLADNPTLFYSQIEVPDNVTDTRTALWEKFHARYKTRSAGAWSEFHRAHRSILEDASRKLIAIRQAREHGSSSQQPGSSSNVHDRATSQLNPHPNSEKPARFGFLSRFQNLLKRTRDEPESSDPSKRLKLEES